MRRRRLTLLLVLVPAALGAAFLYVWSRSDPGGENDPSAPLTVEHVSEDQQAVPAESDSVTASEGVMQGTPKDTVPSTEEPRQEPTAPSQVPAHADTGEVIGQPLLADANSQPRAALQSTGGEPRSIRFASLYATRSLGGAGGGLGSEGRSEVQNPVTETPGTGSGEQPVVPEPRDDAASEGSEGEAPTANTPEQPNSDGDQGGAGSEVTTEGNAKGGGNSDSQGSGSNGAGDNGTTSEGVAGGGGLGDTGAADSGSDHVSPSDPIDAGPQDEGSGEAEQGTPPSGSDAHSGGDSTQGPGGLVDESTPPAVQVPEPGPLGLLLLGLLGIAARRKVMESSR